MHALDTEIEALPLQVIVAEDNVLQRKYLVRLIEKLGYTAIPAEDGAVALELVETSDAQILISDFGMPTLNGIELTNRVRALELDHYVHIIMITGSDEHDLRDQALEVGVDDFLTKGHNLAMLKSRMRTATRLIHHAQEIADRNRVLKEANDRIHQDLMAAAAAQRDLLPDFQESLLGFQIASEFVPSSFVSGDMFGCFPLDQETLAFYAVDVAGHGVHASLLSVAIGHLITPEFFRNKAFPEGGQPDPAALVDALNTRFSKTSGDEYFTMFCGIIDRDSGRLVFCQAGYPSPFYVNGGTDIKQVGDGGFPVGMFSEAEFRNGTLDIEPGGHLVICSDAAVEAEDFAQKPFGSQQLKTIITTASEIGSDAIPKRIIDALTKWRQGRSLEDDLTVIAFERTNPNDPHNFL